MDNFEARILEAKLAAARRANLAVLGAHQTRLELTGELCLQAGGSGEAAARLLRTAKQLRAYGEAGAIGRSR